MSAIFERAPRAIFIDTERLAGSFGDPNAAVCDAAAASRPSRVDALYYNELVCALFVADAWRRAAGIAADWEETCMARGDLDGQALAGLIFRDIRNAAPDRASELPAQFVMDAIDAERERCAKVAECYGKNQHDANRDIQPEYAREALDDAKEIARLIRDQQGGNAT